MNCFSKILPSESTMNCQHRSLRLVAYSVLAILTPMAALQEAAIAKDVEPLAIGASAPELNLPGVDGKTYRLEDFNDAKVLAVVFSCNHCPTAQAYEERIMKLHAD